jgi:hypothetical protein
MLLAMHYQPSPLKPTSDNIRVQSMLDAGLSISTVDLCGGVSGVGDTRGHIVMDFKEAGRSMRSLFQAYQPPKLLILDYFWLQQNYYESNYGENWCEKVSMLFKARQWNNLDIVILPIGSSDDSMRLQMKKMRGNVTTSNHFVMSNAEALRWNPLVCHTVKVDSRLDEFIGEGRCHQVQIERCNGFCVIIRPQMTREEAKAILSRFCPVN